MHFHKHSLLACVTCLTCVSAVAADTWYFMQREEGCLSFATAPAKGYHWLSVPAEVKTPEQVHAHMRKTSMPDARLTPLIEYGPARKPWQTEPIGAPFTRGNAFVVHDAADTKQIIVVTYALRKSVFGFAAD